MFIVISFNYLFSLLVLHVLLIDIATINISFINNLFSLILKRSVKNGSHKLLNTPLSIVFLT